MKTTESDNVTMRSGYWLATIGTKNVIDGAAPLVLQALSNMDVKSTAAFCLTDMGCADGGSSMSLVRQCIEHVREREPSRQVSVVYTDQPRNNYNSLFRILHGIEEGPQPSYLNDFGGVFATASGSSFYRQMVPDNSLDLGFSSTAMHWLSHKPCDITNHVQAVGANGDELAAFQRQAEADWCTILEQRARELRPGGRLVLVNFCRDEQGRFLGNTEGVHMFNAFRDLWSDFMNDGKISAAEYQRMTLPQYYNDVAEFSRPFVDEDSAVYRAGLRLESIETRVVECPFKADFRQHGDADHFATNYVPTLRSWTESTFFGALDGSRPATDRQALIDSFYAAYTDNVRGDPAGHGMDYVHAYIVIRKEG
jgi:hypothetical protein